MSLTIFVGALCFAARQSISGGSVLSKYSFPHRLSLQTTQSKCNVQKLLH